MFYEEKPESEKLVNSNVIVRKSKGKKIIFFLSLTILIAKVIFNISSTQSNTNDNIEITNEQEEIIQKTYDVEQEDYIDSETKYDIDLSAIEELKDQIEE